MGGCDTRSGPGSVLLGSKKKNRENGKARKGLTFIAFTSSFHRIHRHKRQHPPFRLWLFGMVGVNFLSDSVARYHKESGTLFDSSFFFSVLLCCFLLLLLVSSCVLLAFEWFLVICDSSFEELAFLPYWGNLQ